EILFSAMPVHEDAARLWEQSTLAYRGGLRRAAEHLHAQGLVADVARASDVLWFCFGFNAWRTLVKECGWSWDEAETWLAEKAELLLREPQREGGETAARAAGDDAAS